MNLLGIAALNSFVIYVADDLNSSQRKLSQTLGTQLAKPNMERRLRDAKRNCSVYRAIVACGINAPLQENEVVPINPKK